MARRSLDTEDVLAAADCDPKRYSSGERFRQAAQNVVYLSKEFLGAKLYPFEDSYTRGPRDNGLTRQLMGADNGDIFGHVIDTRYEDALQDMTQFVEEYVPESIPGEDAEEDHLHWLEHAAATLYAHEIVECELQSVHLDEEEEEAAVHRNVKNRVDSLTGPRFDDDTWDAVYTALTAEAMV